MTDSDRDPRTGQDVRHRPRPRRPRPQRRSTGRCTASWAQRCREVHDHPRPAGSAARDGGGTPARAATRGPTRPSCTAARLRAGRREALAEPVRRRGDRPPRPVARRSSTSAGGTNCWSASSSIRPRRAAPTRRATGRRSPSSRRSPADVELLLLDEPTSRAGPADGGGIPGASRSQCRRRDRAAVQPHPGRGRGLCDRVSIIRAGRCVEAGTLASCVTSPGPRSRRDRATRRRPRRAARRARPVVDGTGSRFEVDTARSTPCCGDLSRGRA